MLYFVTPAWQRFDLTRVVLEQRRRIIDFLAERNIEGRQIVVANDANADSADALGFDVLRRPNYALARRFNDGIQYAAVAPSPDGMSGTRHNSSPRRTTHRPNSSAGSDPLE